MIRTESKLQTTSTVHCLLTLVTRETSEQLVSVDQWVKLTKVNGTVVYSNSYQCVRSGLKSQSDAKQTTTDTACKKCVRFLKVGAAV